MDKFESEVLNNLIDKFERSKLCKGGSERNIKVRLVTSDKALNSYTGRDSFKFIEENDKKLNALQDKNFVFIYRDRNEQLICVELNVLAVDMIYKYINRENKTEKLKSLLNIAISSLHNLTSL